MGMWVRAGWRWDVLVRSEDGVGWELGGLCWDWPGMEWSEVEVGTLAFQATGRR